MVADQFICFNRNRFVGDALIDYAGHQHDRRLAEFRMLLDWLQTGSSRPDRA